MNFFEKVYEVVRRVPKGRVATYGQIAALAGFPRSARAVGMALRAFPEGTDVPWQRVISSKGYISIENFEHPAEEQASLLIAEGVRAVRQQGVFRVNLQKYLWNPNKK